MTNPSFWYDLYQALRCGVERWQLMHEEAQKSTRTTLPRRLASVMGLLSAVLNHCWIPTKAGAVPQSTRLVASAVHVVLVLVFEPASVLALPKPTVELSPAVAAWILLV